MKVKFIHKTKKVTSISFCYEDTLIVNGEVVPHLMSVMKTTVWTLAGEVKRTASILS